MIFYDDFSQKDWSNDAILHHKATMNQQNLWDFSIDILCNIVILSLLGVMDFTQQQYLETDYFIKHAHFIWIDSYNILAKLTW